MAAMIELSGKPMEILFGSNPAPGREPRQIERHRICAERFPTVLSKVFVKVRHRELAR